MFELVSYLIGLYVGLGVALGFWFYTDHLPGGEFEHWGPPGLSEAITGTFLSLLWLPLLVVVVLDEVVLRG